MTPPDAQYARYLAGLVNLQSAPDKQKLEQKATAANYDSAVLLANDAENAAEQRHLIGYETIERHLRNASGFLAKLNETSRIPPRIKPSVVPATATAGEVDEALARLSDATISIGTSVDAYLAAQRQVPEQIAQPTAHSPEAPRVAREHPSRRRLVLIAGGILVVVAALILVILVISTR